MRVHICPRDAGIAVDQATRCWDRRSGNVEMWLERGRGPKPPPTGARTPGGRAEAARPDDKGVSDKGLVECSLDVRNQIVRIFETD